MGRELHDDRPMLFRRSLHKLFDRGKNRLSPESAALYIAAHRAFKIVREVKEPLSSLLHSLSPTGKAADPKPQRHLSRGGDGGGGCCRRGLLAGQYLPLVCIQKQDWRCP